MGCAEWTLLSHANAILIPNLYMLFQPPARTLPPPCLQVATQLVPKKHIVEDVDMTPMQARLYKSAVESMRREVAAATTAKTTVVVASKSSRGRSRKSTAEAAGPSASVPAGDSVALVAKLGSHRVNNIFTHLRKIAQHPLLVRPAGLRRPSRLTHSLSRPQVRNMYEDDQVQAIAEIASSHGLYGGNCTYERVHKEMMSYSDHQLHTFCSERWADSARKPGRCCENYTSKFLIMSDPASCLAQAPGLRSSAISSCSPRRSCRRPSSRDWMCCCQSCSLPAPRWAFLFVCVFNVCLYSM